MNSNRAQIHHYVPQWYQKRFMLPGQTRYYYLDLNPETIVSGKVRYKRRALLNWGTVRCFQKQALYEMKLGSWSTDQIERCFFGAIDHSGRRAIELFGNYNACSAEAIELFPIVPRYMDAQRFRTPRGLDQLKALTKARDQNETLVLMGRLFQLHSTMWMEGVWEFVRARESPTKFIVTDDPVTFFNPRIFPSEIQYPGTIELDQVGTRTIFPLSLDCCLIITHTELTRNPMAKQNDRRVNARYYQRTIKYMLDIQFGRELEEEEVARINFILKKRANRYIAAAKEEWLYPERHVSVEWSKLDHDWFLLPNLYKVSFTTGIIVGRKDGTSWASDEYGRHPGNPEYDDERRRNKEWQTAQRAKREWAKKRAGKSLAHVDNMEHDEIYDNTMNDHLSEQEK